MFVEVKPEHMRQKLAPSLSIFKLKCDSFFLLTSSLNLPKSTEVFLSQLLQGVRTAVMLNCRTCVRGPMP